MSQWRPYRACPHSCMRWRSTAGTTCSIRRLTTHVWRPSPAIHGSWDRQCVDGATQYAPVSFLGSLSFSSTFCFTSAPPASGLRIVGRRIRPAMASGAWWERYPLVSGSACQGLCARERLAVATVTPSPCRGRGETATVHTRGFRVGVMRRRCGHRPLVRPGESRDL